MMLQAKKRMFLVCLLLPGCAAYQGPPQIINGGGVVNVSEVERTNAVRGDNLALNFQVAVDAAAKVDDQPNVDLMLRTGFVLVQSHCDNFFWKMGQHQRGSRIARDTIAPVSAALTGILAITNMTNIGKKDDLIQAIALGSSALTSGLDIYDTHFLFGAENIDSVRALTFKALSEHRSAVVRDNAKPDNFEAAAMQLIDHQSICTPSHVLALVREAIDKAEPVTKRDDGVALAGGRADAAASQLLLDAGTAAKQLTALSPDQLGALWWVYFGEPKAAEDAEILKRLGALAVSGGVSFPTVSAFVSGYNNAAAVKKLLVELPVDVKNAFTGRLVQIRQTMAANVSRLPAAQEALPAFSINSASAGFAHIKVKIAE